MPVLKPNFMRTHYLITAQAVPHLHGSSAGVPNNENSAQKLMLGPQISKFVVVYVPVPLCM